FDRKFVGTMHEQYVKAAELAIGDWRNGKGGIFSDLLLEAKPFFIREVVLAMQYLGKTRLTDRDIDLLRDVMEYFSMAIIAESPLFPKGKEIINLTYGKESLAKRLLKLQASP